MEDLTRCQRWIDNIRAGGLAKFASVSITGGGRRLKEGNVKTSFPQSTPGAVRLRGKTHQLPEGIPKSSPKHRPFIWGQNHPAGYSQVKAKPGK
jgi:hypothetical protein